MLIHTIVSPYDIINPQENKSEYKEIKYGYIELENGRVKRVISTDPKDYLNEKYKPDY